PEGFAHRRRRQPQIPQLAVGRGVAHALEGEEEECVILRRTRRSPGARVEVAQEPQLPHALPPVKPARHRVAPDERAHAGAEPTPPAGKREHEAHAARRRRPPRAARPRPPPPPPPPP